MIKRNPALVIFLLLAFFSACTKISTTDIGSGLLPPVDNITTFDTFIDVTTKNLSDTFIRVGSSNDHSLGYVSDPLFGNTTATISAQFKPPYYPYKFEVSKDSLKLDSIVLVLSYKSTWGDSTKPLGVRVFEIEPENDFKRDTLIYPSTKIIIPGIEVTESGLPKLVDVRTLKNIFHPTLFREDSLTKNQFRIRLSASFGEKLLKQFDSTTAYHDDTTFSSYLKGIQIVPTEGNALIRVNLLDTNTKLAIYYKYTDTTKTPDTTISNVRYFRVNQFTSATCNTIKKERMGTEVANYIPKNSNLYDTILFMDAGPGIYASIKIPNLNLLPNMIVHRAELLMEQVPDLLHPDEHYFTAPNLFLAAYSGDSMRRFAVPNDVIISSGFVTNIPAFGCLPIKRSGETFAYNFDLTRYLQGIVTRKEKTYDMILWAPYFDGIYFIEGTTIQVGISQSPFNAPGIGRVRLGGGSAVPNLPHKMRFHIVYSKI